MSGPLLQLMPGSMPQQMQAQMFQQWMSDNLGSSGNRGGGNGRSRNSDGEFGLGLGAFGHLSRH
jgi:hypothetical protein